MVLTIGVGSCLFVSAVLLPALLTLWSRLSYRLRHGSLPLADGQVPATGPVEPPVDMEAPHVPPELSIYYPNDHAA